MKFATNDFADSSVARIEKPAARLYDESYGNSAIEAMKQMANKKAKDYENNILPELSFCDKDGNKVDKECALKGFKNGCEKDGGMKDGYGKKFQKDGGMKSELPEGDADLDNGGLQEDFSAGKKIVKDGGPKDPVGDVQVGGGDKKPPAAEVQVGGGELKDWFRGENREERRTPSDNGTSSGRSDGNFQPNLPGYQEGENR